MSKVFNKTNKDSQAPNLRSKSGPCKDQQRDSHATKQQEQSRLKIFNKTDKKVHKCIYRTRMVHVRSLQQGRKEDQ